MLLGFQKKFKDKIVSGEKRQTIRAKRKYPIKVNDKLQFYTGLRTKYCEKIMDDMICREIHEIEITKNKIVRINDYLIDCDQKEIIAKADGFNNFDEMYNWFCKNHNLENKNFHGNIICW